jgi:hypothetical protein
LIDSGDLTWQPEIGNFILASTTALGSNLNLHGSVEFR